jgi:hypothetical protein
MRRTKAKNASNGPAVGQDLFLGLVAGAAGTAAMDLVLYARYRRGGGKDSMWKWESAETVKNWDEASAPGQVGEKIEALFIHHPLPDKWARSTTNVVHWATGAGWGLQYGLLAGKSRHRWALLASLGPAAWLSSYATLPLVKIYKPIWDYDAKTLGQDLSAHLVYGLVTGATFAALGRAVSGRRAKEGSP